LPGDRIATPAGLLFRNRNNIAPNPASSRARETKCIDASYHSVEYKQDRIDLPAEFRMTAT
jgi:hypothetical protein